jgi:hypothetical protein
MAANFDPNDRPPSDQLHPKVIVAIFVLGLWLVLSIWGFVGRGYADLALAVASLFVLIALGLPGVLWLITRRARPAPDARDQRESFARWITGEFETHRGRLKASDALIEVLLPIAAVSFGMTIFALTLHFVVGSGA